MAEPIVVDADLEVFLLAFARRELELRPEPICEDVHVVRVEPSGEVPGKTVVVRYDGGSDTSVISSEASVGVSVLAGTKDNPKDAFDLARILKGILRTAARVESGNPVAAVLTSNGPYQVQENQPHARVYMTFTFSVVGEVQ